MRRGVLVLVALLGFVATLAVTIVLAQRERGATARCPPGTKDRKVRCCPPGQLRQGDGCQGKPSTCPPGLAPAPAGRGCVAVHRKVPLAAGEVTLEPRDWEAQGLLMPRRFLVDAFRLDSHEVTHARWDRCVTAQKCRRLASSEPGLPVTGVTPREAETFCAFTGGQLPTGQQWLLAAVGPQTRRFPWGPTGLVCRRAVFGLRSGPCAQGGESPELAGLRPAGRTEDGIHDLAGNVAEWTREGDGRYLARGGSYASRVAAELKSWAAMEATPSPEVGFRCAYGALQSRR